MKKLAAILLIALFLFNLVGYRLVIKFAQRQSDLSFQTSLDKSEYNEAELITIRVPLSLPYQNNRDDFERVDGEITSNGKIYKYVKRKIEDGSLILLCLPDQQKMQLESAKDDFFKYSNDLVQNGQSKKQDHNKSQVKGFTCEYEVVNSYLVSCSNLEINLIYIQIEIPHLSSACHSSPDQPPEFA